MSTDPIGRETAFSPLNDIFQIYFEGLEIFSSPFQPILKSYARSQLEVYELMSRRARAQIECSARLVRCAHPQDVMDEFAQYWESALSDLGAATARITDAMAPVAHASLPIIVAAEPDATTEAQLLTVTRRKPQDRYDEMVSQRRVA